MKKEDRNPHSWQKQQEKQHGSKQDEKQRGQQHDKRDQERDTHNPSKKGF